MSEPVILYAADGSELVAYGKAQQAALEAEGYRLTPPEPVVTEVVTEAEPPVAPEPDSKPAPKTRGKGQKL